jgi:hypothetical protein
MNDPETEIIKFKAIISRINTTIDGGINLTLSLDAGEINAVAALLEARRINALLEVLATYGS